MPQIALTREVSHAIGQCELTHLDREPIDLFRARDQHGEYEAVLRELGCRVERIPPAPELPDSVFVEDPAVVFDEIAILTRPGAKSRRAESASVAEALDPYRELARVTAPGTVDGGDVLVLGRSVYVGLTGRSNEAAVSQMGEFLAPFGYQVQGAKVAGCLHLKSAVTVLGENEILYNPAWVDPEQFSGVESIAICPSEPAAANALRVGDVVLLSDSFPETAGILRERGFEIRTIAYSELAKAEGALTCCSLIFESAI